MAIATAALARGVVRFEVEAGPFAAGELRVLGFEARERLSEPFEATVTASPRDDVDPAALVGEPARLRVRLRDEDRVVDGVVARILTSSPTHPHGIKVMLEDGKVGRVQAILSD